MKLQDSAVIQCKYFCKAHINPYYYVLLYLMIKYLMIVTAIQSSQLLNTPDAESTVDIADHNNKLGTELSTRRTEKSRKRSSTYKVSINVKYVKLSPGASRVTCEPTFDAEQQAEHSNYMHPSLVNMKFLDLKLQLERILESKHIISKCGSLLASDTHNIPLLPTDYTEKLREIQHTPELIQKLNPFMTWDNHTILSTIAADMPEATMLLTQFDDGIDSSQPLTSFPIPAPSHHMVPYDNSTHTVLAVKLDLELYQSTLQNVIDARSLIQDQCKLTSHCLQLLAVAKTNSTIIYWMIPRNIAHLITANVVQFQNHYHQKGILQLAVYPGAVLCTGSALKVGPLSFFNQHEVGGKLVSAKMFEFFSVGFCAGIQKCK